MQILIPVILLLTAAALATGSPVFLAAAVLLSLLILLGLISVLWTSATLRIEAELSEQTVHRGEHVTLKLQARHRCLLPVAPLLLEVSSSPETEPQQMRLKEQFRGGQQLTIPFRAAHVGVSAPGVQKVTVEDLLGIFSRSRQPKTACGELLVLPLSFGIHALTYAPGEPGIGTMARATEDITSPSDTRSYQPGDAMKKIHWKLSLRKGDLVVRRFEEPILPEALVLMDCSPPPHWGHDEAEADIRDTLLETAASVMLHNTGEGHRLRMPLLGSHPVEVEGNMPESMILENLARVDFSETDRFERVLNLEMRRIRQMGSVVIISARLSGSIVEAMTRMRRMGPEVRLYFVTFTPDDERIIPFVSRLQQASCEVCYVTPDPVKT